MGVETFKLRGGACKSTDGNAGVIAALAQAGMTGTDSSGVITVTRTDLDGADALGQFEALCRIARSSNAKLAYVVSS